MSLVGKLTRALREEGVAASAEKVAGYLRRWQDERRSAKLDCYTEADFRAQRAAEFSPAYCISIIVPLYNTPLNFLREMVASVQGQTYSNWQLCLADGSDADHGEVEQFCRSAAEQDSRICYQRLAKNEGISGNTNAALALSTGEYIALLDHDDQLHPAALYEVMQAITAQGADFVYTDENTFHNTPKDAFSPNYKPDFAPDTLRSYNYICHLTVFARRLMDKVGVFRSACDGSQDYDLILRLTEQAEKIVHVPHVLYYWRASEQSTAADISAKPYVMAAAKKALSDHLERVGLIGEVLDSAVPSTYRIRYALQGEPLISILIPSCDHWETLKRCVDSILEKSTYRKFEIIIIENNSTQQETFAYYKTLENQSQVRVIRWQDKFNYSAINNFGASHAKGDYFLLLNNDVSVITPEWLEEMLMFAQRDEVGAVGALLYYPSDKVQHAGIIVGIGGVAENAFKNARRGDFGYMSRLSIAQNLSAVTAACLLVSRKAYEQVGGLDEGFEVAFNDVDFCMQLRKAGYLNVFTPYAQLYHYESESRGAENTPEKRKRFQGEIARFQTRWQAEMSAGDPYYNPNLSLRSTDFRPKNTK
jgi:O-antigen biosynthesis protein